MHSSFSTNILTQCPAQTCLSVGSSNNYGKGSSDSLRNLPARVLKTGDSSKKSKPVRRSLKSRSRRDATTTAKAQSSTSNSSLNSNEDTTSKDGRQLYNPLAVDCLTENVLRIEGAHMSVPKGLLARSKSRLQTQGRSKVTLDQEIQRLPSVPSPSSSTSSGVLGVAGAKSKSIFPSSPTSSPKVMAIMERQQLGSGDASPLVGLLSTWDSRSDDSTFNNKGSEKSQCVALPLLKQRLGYLWENKMFTDVMFIVGRDKVSIEAHRMILASASEVFRRLLYDEAKPMISDDKFLLYENEFSVPAFEVFIKAMYTNEIPICLTLPLALEVFYASKKYAVLFLEDQIVEHIRQVLTAANVFEVLRFTTNAVELSYLAPICWKIIEEQTSEVLEYHMDKLDAHTFAKILERDRLNLDEVDLFKMTVKWAANLCKSNSMKTTGKNKRHFMEPLIRHFRFTTMTPNQFKEVVIPSRILETREAQQIQCIFNRTSDVNVTLPYKALPRFNTSHIIVQQPEFTTNSDSKNHWLETGKNVPKICSDSAVIAPHLGSKNQLRRGSSTKVKQKRATTHNNKYRLKD